MAQQTTFYTQRAEACYANKKYDSAMYYYRLQLKLVNAPELHFNCGNAAYKAGNLGYAMWHYNTAIKLKPGYTNAIRNLKMLHHKKPQHEFQLWNYLILNVHFALSSRFWFTFNVIMLCIGLLVFAYRLKYTLKPHFLFNLLFFSMFTFTLSMGLWQYHYQTSKDQGVITSTQVKYFAEPNSASESFGTLSEGTYFTPLQTSDHWTLIETEYHQEGWVPNTCMRLF